MVSQWSVKALTLSAVLRVVNRPAIKYLHEMKILRVLFVLLLAGCGGATAPAPSPTASPVAEVSPTPSPVVPLMDGFPTGFAPCAGNAETVKQAAYNCLRDWKPERGEYQGEVVYHFSPSLSPSRQAKIKEVTMFTLSRTEGFVEYMGFSSSAIWLEARCSFG